MAFRASRVTPLRITALILFALGLALLVACLFYLISDTYTDQSGIVAAASITTASAYGSSASVSTIEVSPYTHHSSQYADGIFGIEELIPILPVTETETIAVKVEEKHQEIYGITELPQCSHCSLDARLVCGINGKTYLNRCFMLCHGVSRARAIGACVVTY
jgi:hypothetical protein